MTERALRILLLGDSRSFKLESYVPELHRQNCDVLLASVENGTLEHYQLHGRGPIRQLHYRLAAGQLRRLISEYRPDIIDAHDANYGFMAAVALRNATIPMTICLLGPDILVVPHKSFLHRKKTIMALRRADAVIADSEYLLDETRKLAPLKVTMVAPFGIEERYLEFHKRDYTVSTPLRIIVPRHQEKVYNNMFILKSLTQLVRDSKISLTFADFGSLAGEMKEAAGKLGSPNIHFYARKNRETFLKFMSGHDVYLSAALTDSSPVSLIDAMAMGLIPVVPELPGIKEWSDDEGALTFTQHRADKLVAAINFILEGKASPEMRRRNLEKVRRKAIFENYVAERIELMKKVVG